jgi:hypothetical protein
MLQADRFRFLRKLELVEDVELIVLFIAIFCGDAVRPLPVLLFLDILGKVAQGLE